MEGENAGSLRIVYLDFYFYFGHADLLLYHLALTAHDEAAILRDSDLLLARWIAPSDGRMDHLKQNEHGYNSVEHLSSIQIRK